ncbi:MAG: hypothetical protein OEW87_04185 [Flavobacteriaceae bacterium]|nr:hypothetical protein [Flavobacteriaceae bacterium]
MNAPYYLEKGLTIEKHGEKYEFTRHNGNLYQFESIQTGEIISFTESKFFSEWREQLLTIVPVNSSPKNININLDQLSTASNDLEIKDLSEILDVKKLDDALRLENYIKILRKNKVTKGMIKIIEDEIPRIAEELEDDNPPAASTLARKWRKYEAKNDSIWALVDNRSMPAKRNRRSTNHDKFIRNIIDDLYMKEGPESISNIYETYENILPDFNLANEANGIPQEEKVSERTLYRIIGKLNKFDVIAAQQGTQEAKRQLRLMKGHLYADYPLQFVEIDHTPLDIFVIDDKLSIPLGRPWLTIIKDRFSKVIIGLFVTFAKTGTDSIFGALKYSIQPHEKAHERWPDIENVLPWGQGQTYVVDRGKDFLGTRFRLALRQIGSDYEYCAVRSPWLKGSVERAFLSLNFLLETLPGRTFPRLEQRKDYNPLKHAVIRFSSFVYILYKWACDIHNVTPHSRKLARPLDMWNDGLSEAPRSIPILPTALDTYFGKPVTSKLRHDGIKFKYLHYANSPRLEEIYRQYGKGLKISYRVNISDLGYIMVMDPRNNEFFRVPCLDQDYSAGLSLIQHDHIRKWAKQNLAELNISESLYKAKHIIAEQVQEELDSRNTKSKSQLARYAGITSETVLDNKEATLLSIQEHTNQKIILTPSTDIITDVRESKSIERVVPRFGWVVK